MVHRDVSERHHTSNVEALRRLQRQLLANPAGKFSVSKPTAPEPERYIIDFLAG